MVKEVIKFNDQLVLTNKQTNKQGLKLTFSQIDFQRIVKQWLTW